MRMVNHQLTLKTKGYSDIINITDDLESILRNEKFKNGVMVVTCPGSTGAVTTCEYESGLIEDLKELFERLIPQNKRYAHDAAWGDGNGFSHLRASLIGPSLSIPFDNGRLVLGTWQQIIFIDFDNRPRDRRLHVQFIGD